MENNYIINLKDREKRLYLVLKTKSLRFWRKKILRRQRPKIEVNPTTPLEKYIASAVGPEALLVFKALQEEDGDVTEDVLAEKLNFSKNMTRRLLYRLQDINFVVYKRVRNKDTGWYYYYWRINRDGLTLVLLELKKEILDKLKEKLSAVSIEQGTYKCPSCNREYSFDEAFDREFRCSSCNVELVYHDKSRHKLILEKYIAKLEEELINEKKKLQSS